MELGMPTMKSVPAMKRYVALTSAIADAPAPKGQAEQR
jgi:hypothetical protein